MEEDVTRGVCERLARAVSEGVVTTPAQLAEAKRVACARAAAPRVPSDAEVLACLSEAEREAAAPLLRTKPSRTLSGVAVVAVMSPPSRCPHGRCAYCPGGVDEGTPQSYTGDEPAARRARRAGYDPGLQVRGRLAQLAAAGHATDKVELVLMGGTFPATERTSRDGFVRACIEALNGAPSDGLAAAIAANEEARHRCVALTVETRPDLCTPAGVDDLLTLGTTRVEVGVQTTVDRVLDMVGRGHHLRESVEATRALKDAGLKVGHHLMPGLPGLTPEEDLAAMLRVVEDPALRPDLLKLYPTLVMPGTRLYEMWSLGQYEPLDEGAATELLARFKSRLPRWVRVSRVERDIPSQRIAAGVWASNLRQLVHRRLDSQGMRCACVRCREVGRRGTDRPVEGPGTPPDARDLELREDRYEASGGEERFLSLELPHCGEDALVAYARVRRPSPLVWRPELEGAALLREVRVLGEVLPLGSRPSDARGSLQWQHRGLGARLVGEAERAALAWGMDRLAVTAGMGARPYFRGLGYSLEGHYMVRAVA